MISSNFVVLQWIIPHLYHYFLNFSVFMDYGFQDHLIHSDLLCIHSININNYSVIKKNIIIALTSDLFNHSAFVCFETVPIRRVPLSFWVILKTPTRFIKSHYIFWKSVIFNTFKSVCTNVWSNFFNTGTSFEHTVFKLQFLHKICQTFSSLMLDNSAIIQMLSQ